MVKRLEDGRLFVGLEPTPETPKVETPITETPKTEEVKDAPKRASRPRKK